MAIALQAPNPAGLLPSPAAAVPKHDNLGLFLGSALQAVGKDVAEYRDAKDHQQELNDLAGLYQDSDPAIANYLKQKAQHIQPDFLGAALGQDVSKSRKDTLQSILSYANTKQQIDAHAKAAELNNQAEMARLQYATGQRGAAAEVELNWKTWKEQLDQYDSDIEKLQKTYATTNDPSLMEAIKKKSAERDQLKNNPPSTRQVLKATPVNDSGEDMSPRLYMPDLPSKNQAPITNGVDGDTPSLLPPVDPENNPNFTGPPSSLKSPITEDPNVTIAKAASASYQDRLDALKQEAIGEANSTFQDPKMNDRKQSFINRINSTDKPTVIQSIVKQIQSEGKGVDVRASNDIAYNNALDTGGVKSKSDNPAESDHGNLDGEYESSVSGFSQQFTGIISKLIKDPATGKFGVKVFAHVNNSPSVSPISQADFPDVYRKVLASLKSRGKLDTPEVSAPAQSNSATDTLNKYFKKPGDTTPLPQ